jgi:hypothetical protein
MQMLLMKRKNESRTNVILELGSKVCNKSICKRQGALDT